MFHEKTTCNLRKRNIKITYLNLNSISTISDWACKIYINLNILNCVQVLIFKLKTLLHNMIGLIIKV